MLCLSMAMHYYIFYGFATAYVHLHLEFGQMVTVGCLCTQPPHDQAI